MRRFAGLVPGLVLPLAAMLAAPNAWGEPITPMPVAAEEPAEAREAAVETEPAAVKEAAPAVKEAPPAEPATGAVETGHVVRAAITSEVLEREPVDALAEVAADRERVFFFTDLRDLTGHTVLHRWSLEGEVLAEVPFRVGGPRWRVYSSKNLRPDWVGAWTVSVVDAESGAVLREASFTTVSGALPPETAGAPEEASPPAAAMP